MPDDVDLRHDGGTPLPDDPQPLDPLPENPPGAANADAVRAAGDSDSRDSSPPLRGLDPLLVEQTARAIARSRYERARWTGLDLQPGEREAAEAALRVIREHDAHALDALAARYEAYPGGPTRVFYRLSKVRAALGLEATSE